MKTGFVPRVVAAVLAALVGLVGIATPAHAEQDKLKLSFTSGGPFSDHLSGPLFTGTYVPGSATSTFYVKNDSSQTARATIALVEKTPANAFEAALSFQATAGGFTNGVPVYLSSKKNRCRTLVTGPVMNGGAIQRIDVTMLIDEDLPETAQGLPASFSFVVTLSQVTNKGKVDVCGDQSPGVQSIQVMGAQTNVSADLTDPREVAAPRSDASVAALASMFLAAGALLLLVVRRRRRPAVGQ